MYAYIALAALQAVGGFQQADTIRKNGDLQAQVSQFNKQFADIDAHNALTNGYGQAARYQTIVDSTIGAGRAAYASQNVQVGYGTAGDVERDNRIAGLVNTLQIQKSARDQAVGYQAQSINLQLGGKMIQLQSNLQANAAQSGGIMQAASTAVAGYERSQSTGKGNTSRTGTNDQSWKADSKTMHVTDDGAGMKAPPDKTGMGWYPDKNGSMNPGFYGRGPADSYKWDQALGSYSFTGETGG